MLTKKTIEALQYIESEYEEVKITYFAPYQNEVGVILPEDCGEERELHLRGRNSSDQIQSFKEQIGLDLLEIS